MKSFVKGLIFGGLSVGFVTALNTPKNGKELRADIKNEAKILYDESIEEIKNKVLK